jgi:hypothetical protein
VEIGNLRTDGISEARKEKFLTDIPSRFNVIDAF